MNQSTDQSARLTVEERAQLVSILTQRRSVGDLIEQRGKRLLLTSAVPPFVLLLSLLVTLAISGLRHVGLLSVNWSPVAPVIAGLCVTAAVVVPLLVRMSLEIRELGRSSTTLDSQAMEMLVKALGPEHPYNTRQPEGSQQCDLLGSLANSLRSAGMLAEYPELAQDALVLLLLEQRNHPERPVV